MKKTLSALSLSLALFATTTAFASAHVIVTPATAGVGSYQTFTVSVPSEKNVPTTGVRLQVPAGVTDVTPTVKFGWTLSKTEISDASMATTTQITWTGSHIPVGQRDEFSFSAKVPGEATTIAWKVYQTYSDGSVVSWDMQPHEHEEGMEDDSEDSEDSGAYSETAVVDDLTPEETHADVAPWALGISLLALLISLYAVSRKTIVENS